MHHRQKDSGRLRFISPSLPILRNSAVRSYYYTSVVGDSDKVRRIENALWDLGFTARVFKKEQKSRAKAVDIALTTEMLSHAFGNHYDAAVLITGDGDFLPVVEQVKRINLKETGQCTVQFPEALFDMDYPGHYLRRIKSLGVTIPCVVGPYTSINCTLTLAANKIRFNNTPADAKDYVKDSDNNFLTNFAAAESITTSSGQNDSGLFALNFNDERYLPFEGAGVISTWRLSVPQETNAFDFETISDVIFNLKYTARDGGESLRAIARAAAVLPPGSAPGATADGGAQSPLPRQTTLARAFSLRHEFPSDWYNFLHPPDSVPDQTMAINLTQDRFPFRYRGKKIQIYQIDMFLRFRDIFDPVKYTANGTPLGDYVATAVWLKLNIAPPGGGAIPLQLVSNAAVLAGVPYGTVPQLPSTFPPVPPPLGGLGAWKIVANGTDIARIAASLHTQVTSGENIYNRLVLEAIEDMFLVCQFASA